MPRKKKVTIKHFLNTAVTTAVDHYPLYVMVTYDRKNTQFKSLVFDFFKDIEDAKKDIPHKLAFEERVIRALVEFEVEFYSEKLVGYSVKGLGSRYNVLSISMYHLLTNYLNEMLRKIVLKCSPKEFFQLVMDKFRREDFSLLYEACRRLFDDFEDHTTDLFRKRILYFEEYNRIYDLPRQVLKYQHCTLVEWFNPEVTLDYGVRLVDGLKLDEEEYEARMTFIKDATEYHMEAHRAEMEDGVSWMQIQNRARYKKRQQSRKRKAEGN